MCFLRLDKTEKLFPLFTLVRFIACVNAHVYFEIGQDTKIFVTNFTLVRLFARMNLHVFIKRT